MTNGSQLGSGFLLFSFTLYFPPVQRVRSETRRYCCCCCDCRSLGSGLFYLSKDDQNSPRVLKALKIRVALSAILIIFLIVSYYMGWTNK